MTWPSEAQRARPDSLQAEIHRTRASVVAFEDLHDGRRDFSAQLTKIKSANPDVRFLPAYYNDVGLISQQARRQGITSSSSGRMPGAARN
jgi:branched-chain amino acid transport system substrate-binding protein